jgi:hypothetical protein
MRVAAGPAVGVHASDARAVGLGKFLADSEGLTTRTDEHGASRPSVEPDCVTTVVHYKSVKISVSVDIAESDIPTIRRT